MTEAIRKRIENFKADVDLQERFRDLLRGISLSEYLWPKNHARLFPSLFLTGSGSKRVAYPFLDSELLQEYLKEKVEGVKAGEDPTPAILAFRYLRQYEAELSEKRAPLSRSLTEMKKRFASKGARGAGVASKKKGAKKSAKKGSAKGVAKKSAPKGPTPAQQKKIDALEEELKGLDLGLRNVQVLIRKLPVPPSLKKGRGRI